jgi:hypothetical protein
MKKIENQYNLIKFINSINFEKNFSNLISFMFFIKNIFVLMKTSFFSQILLFN